MWGEYFTQFDDALPTEELARFVIKMNSRDFTKKVNAVWRGGGSPIRR